MGKREFLGVDMRRNDFWVLVPLWIVGAVCSAWVMTSWGAEADYAEPWCERMGGRSELVLADRSRVDCLLGEHAVEVDFARKWAEAMGQALHYARMTDRLPGVMLILEKPGDRRYVTRLYADAERWGIPLFVWTVDGFSLTEGDL